MVIYKNIQTPVLRSQEGLKQGGGMSPALFTVFMYHIINKCNQRTRNLFISYKNLQAVDVSECSYGDDVVIMLANEK